MKKSSIARAVLLGGALFISSAGAAWEVSYESGATSLSGLDLKTWPVGYCLGYYMPDAGSGGHD